MNKTFVMLKPRSLKRGLVGKIITRFEDKGLRINSIEVVQLDEVQATVHYAHLKRRKFFKELIAMLQDGPVIAMVLEGEEDIICMVRKMIGATDPHDALPGTIRGDFALKLPFNLVHASDSETAVHAEVENILGAKIV